MKRFIQYSWLVGLLIMGSCEDLVDGINENPNDITIEEIDADLFLTGAMLANAVAQAGHLNRISGMYTGQLVGLTSLYSNIYGFALSTAESVTTWSRIYVGTVPNLRHIREQATDDVLLQGITKVVEAHAVGTAASLFGDVPFSQISDLQVPDPVFDSQISVLSAVIDLLDNAITDLNNATSRVLATDIYYEGDAVKWLEAAYTLKARYHLIMRDYDAAFNAAINGISDDDRTMRYIPRGDPNIAEGDKNLFWTILEGSRAGDIGTGKSYLMQLLSDTTEHSRNNPKTNEAARLGYYTIDESGGSVNDGIIEQFEPHRLVSYAENLLTLAEAAARTSGIDEGLKYLNELRSWMSTGSHLNENYRDAELRYDPYELTDFEAGGLENPDGIDPVRALLREIIEERYVSGFGMYMPFDDARRLRKGEEDIAVPFFMVDGPSPPYAERMPYSDDELNSNANAPAEDPGIFTKTEVNK